MPHENYRLPSWVKGALSVAGVAVAGWLTLEMSKYSDLPTNVAIQAVQIADLKADQADIKATVHAIWRAMPRAGRGDR